MIHLDNGDEKRMGIYDLMNSSTEVQAKYLAKFKKPVDKGVYIIYTGREGMEIFKNLNKKP